MDIYETVTKLIGPICPVGDSALDDDRYENLKNMAALVDKLLSDIDDIMQCECSHEFSVKRAGKFASDFFDRLGIEEEK